MDVRVAQVHRHGVGTVLCDDGLQPGLDDLESLLPGGRDVGAVSLDKRGAQPIRVFVELAEGRALGADETVAEDIVAVTSRPQVASQRGQVL
jgi:hypothetical protein